MCLLEELKKKEMKMIDEAIQEALDVIENMSEFDGSDIVKEALEESLLIIEYVFGPLPTKNQLHQALDEVVIEENEYPEPATIKPVGEFCPKCGCHWAQPTGNMTSYPDHYEEWHCMRCGFLVAMIDNSPYMHALEFKDFDYEIA